MPRTMASLVNIGALFMLMLVRTAKYQNNVHKKSDGKVTFCFLGVGDILLEIQKASILFGR
jgi:hypothetical protein